MLLCAAKHTKTRSMPKVCAKKYTLQVTERVLRFYGNKHTLEFLNNHSIREEILRNKVVWLTP